MARSIVLLLVAACEAAPEAVQIYSAFGQEPLAITEDGIFIAQPEQIVELDLDGNLRGVVVAQDTNQLAAGFGWVAWSYDVFPGQGIEHHVARRGPAGIEDIVLTQSVFTHELLAAPTGIVILSTQGSALLWGASGTPEPIASAAGLDVRNAIAADETSFFGGAIGGSGGIYRFAIAGSEREKLPVAFGATAVVGDRYVYSSTANFGSGFSATIRELDLVTREDHELARLEPGVFAIAIADTAVFADRFRITGDAELHLPNSTTTLGVIGDSVYWRLSDPETSEQVIFRSNVDAPPPADPAPGDDRRPPFL